ncbi:MAG: hypothetical protein IJZ02_01925 [Clostridia bacterium]|nr:hypothetical protein [Clostridia bacterium]
MMNTSLYTIGLDLGTSSAKGALVAADNTVIAERTVKMNYRTDAGYTGFDAAAFADDVIGLIRELAAALPEGGRVTGIAAVCAAGNTLLCDKDGKPMIDAFSWTCAPMMEEAEAVYYPTIPAEEMTREATRARTGWGFSGSFPLGHLAYLKVHHPELLANAAYVTMSGEYLLYRLCGKWGIDRSTATPFFLLEQETGRWYKPYLDALGITEDKLPTVGRSGDLLGHLTPEAAEACGLDTNCEVRLGSFDHPGGARASNVTEEGDLLVSCGTSWVCFFPVRNRQLILDQKLLCDPYRSPEGCWAGMFSVARVGELIDRAVKLYAGEDDARFDRFYNMAKEAGTGAGGVKIDLKEELPAPDGKNNANLARALIEAIAGELRDSMRRIEAEGITFRRAVMAGGPSRNPICRDITAEVIGIPVEYHYGVSSGAVGAAMLARGTVS